MSSTRKMERAEVSVSNIGGIDQTQVELNDGVNVLVGRNATNRTSFLQALRASVGSSNVSLRGGVDEGYVKLAWDEDNVKRHLTRNGEHVSFSGDALLDDTTLADLFAFLLEDNDARRAVELGEDLRDLIMRPVDTERIESQIEELVEERRQLEKRIEEGEDAESRLPELTQRRTEIEEEIEGKEAELEEKREEIETANASVQQKKAEEEKLESAFDDLNSKQLELDRVRDRLESERDSLASVRDEREEVATELGDLPEGPDSDQDGLEDQIRSLRAEKRSVESTIKQLRNLIQFNEEMLTGDNEDLLRILEAESARSDGDVTDELLPGGSMSVCWTCGTEVEREQLEETLGRLRSAADDKRQKSNDLGDELDELQEQKREARQSIERRERLEGRLEDLEGEIEQRENEIDRLKDRRSEVSETVEELEDEVAALESESHDELLERHREANQIEFEIDNLRDDLDGVEKEMTAVKSLVEERETLEGDLEEVKAEHRDLRTRIEELEENAVEAFNEHMEEVLDLLEYDNIERIWIERGQTEVREGRRKVEKSVFNLHVVRSTDDGVAYEDTVDNLSESEREVTGLVFALAGYLAHDVHEEVPFMLLDSLEAIDSDRIARLIDYFEEYVPFLVVALLEEDAQSLDADYRRIEGI